MPFLDRRDAGRKLAAVLAPYKSQKPVVLGLPRGGVIVAAEVAAALEAPLDLLIVRKIGVPAQPELAMGAVVGGLQSLVVRNEDVIRECRVAEQAFAAAQAAELVEIERRRAAYAEGRARPATRNRIVILVDDGVATGATMRAALRALRAGGARRLVVATPVAPVDVERLLETDADLVVCLEAYADFGAIGLYYDDFRQTSDEEVVAALGRCKAQGDP